VITVPKDAVLIKKHGNVVYVVKEGKAEERLVKVGVTNGDRVEITEGLKEGETVVTSGQNMLTEGSAVKIL
jgi:multidrug efflux pump subunit AcrA (membrane-fusion protein)